tara:strand:- start:359 stop:931 length:573 start_codon:yes stop_codon:yes gene_type:complete
MACNKCGNTKSSPCACQDHGLTTPCSYADCTSPSSGREGHPEHCAEIYCTDCIARCRNSIQAPNGSNQYLYANAADKLDTIIQRMFLFATQPACYNLSIPHLWHDESLTTQTTITLKWDSVPSVVTAIDVQYATMNGAWVTDTAVDLTPQTIEYTVGNVLALVPNTQYRFRLVSDNGACTSVELIARTIN